MVHGPAFAIVARTNGATWLIFEWDAENDQYVCPEGHALKQFRSNYSDPNRGPTGKGTARYAVRIRDGIVYARRNRATPGKYNVQAAF